VVFPVSAYVKRTLWDHESRSYREFDVLESTAFTGPSAVVSLVLDERGHISQTISRSWTRAILQIRQSGESGVRVTAAVRVAGDLSAVQLPHVDQ